jgi:hypothetical protein
MALVIGETLGWHERKREGEEGIRVFKFCELVRLERRRGDLWGGDFIWGFPTSSLSCSANDYD